MSQLDGDPYHYTAYAIPSDSKGQSVTEPRMRDADGPICCGFYVPIHYRGKGNRHWADIDDDVPRNRSCALLSDAKSWEVRRMLTCRYVHIVSVAARIGYHEGSGETNLFIYSIHMIDGTSDSSEDKPDLCACKGKDTGTENKQRRKGVRDGNGTACRPTATLRYASSSVESGILHLT